VVEVEDKNMTVLQQLEQNWIAGKAFNLDQQHLKLMVTFYSNYDLSPKLKEVLITVNSIESSDSLEVIQFEKIPAWFASECTKPLTETEMQIWLAKWRSLSTEEQLIFEEEKGWSLEDWLHWMKSENRNWFLIDCRGLGDNKYELTLSVTGWPVPLGSIKWLLKAAKARSIEVVENR
jgi:hypothetical protein